MLAKHLVFFFSSSSFLKNNKPSKVTSHGSLHFANGTPLQHSCLENPMDGGAW